jgi:hypothetical protein
LVVVRVYVDSTWGLARFGDTGYLEVDEMFGWIPGFLGLVLVIALKTSNILGAVSVAVVALQFSRHTHLSDLKRKLTHRVCNENLSSDVARSVWSQLKIFLARNGLIRRSVMLAFCVVLLATAGSVLSAPGDERRQVLSWVALPRQDQVVVVLVVLEVICFVLEIFYLIREFTYSQTTLKLEILGAARECGVKGFFSEKEEKKLDRIMEKELPGWSDRQTSGPRVAMDGRVNAVGHLMSNPSDTP